MNIVQSLFHTVKAEFHVTDLDHQLFIGKRENLEVAEIITHRTDAGQVRIVH